MKKFVVLFCLLGAIFYCNSAMAQKRIQLSKDVAVVSYGNVNVIEDDITKMSYEIKVAKVDNDLYEVFCNNSLVRRVTKATLAVGITSAITYATGGIGFVGDVAVSVAVDAVYDKVCDYFGERKER